ncbi:lectin ADEL, partial [Lingula anatina]|uniref:Lectin ADEL n=1 Tax=Lingula anatina TaxID=7574 RepID=A0A2R2MNG9_LINAN
RFYIDFNCRNVKTSGVYCSSRNYEYAECPVGGVITSVKVAKKHSRSSCDLNRSFGFLANNIWVDNGCRATFTVQYCADRKCSFLLKLKRRLVQGIGLQMNISSAVQVELSIQDLDQALEVKDVFAVRANTEEVKMEGQMIVVLSLCLIGIWGTSEAATGIFDCDSNGYRHNPCCTGVDVISATVMTKRSRSSCDVGHSFAVNGCDLWVNHGCRARFYVDFNCGNVKKSNADCSSHNYKYFECPVDGVITSINVAKKHSRSSCDYNKSFGFLGNKIWVNKGCRATFTVQYCADRKCSC